MFSLLFIYSSIKQLCLVFHLNVWVKSEDNPLSVFHHCSLMSESWSIQTSRRAFVGLHRLGPEGKGQPLDDGVG